MEFIRLGLGFTIVIITMWAVFYLALIAIGLIIMLVDKLAGKR